MYIHDLEGRFLDANNTALDLLGYTKEEITSLTFSSLLEEDQLPQALEALEEIKRYGSQKAPTAYKLKKKGGGYLWVETDASLLYREGNPYAIQGIAWDITERKKAEEKIEQLHKVAAKMETVTSEEEICQLTVDAAEKILEFNVCGIDLVENERFVVKAVSSDVGSDGYVSRPISEGGLDSKAYLNKKSYLTKDIRKSKDAKPVKGEYRSGISVPVGEMGIFQAISTLVNNFDEKDLEMAELLISHTIEALKRIRSEKELRKGKEKIEQLHNVAVKMATVTSEEEICRLTTDAAEKILDFNTVVIFIRRGNTLAATSRSTSLPDEEGADMKIDEGIAGKSYQTGQSYLVKDVRRERIARPSSDKYRSAMSIPIGKFGVFQAISTEINSFNQEDLKMGELLVSHAREALTRISDGKALRESEKRYRTLFERVPVGIYRTTPEGKIVDTNPALVRMLGYPDKKSLISLRAIDLFVDPERRKLQRMLLKQKKVVREFETQMRRYDGTIIWMQDNARAVQDKEENVLFYEGTLKDITERKKAEKEVEFYNSLLRHDIGNKNQIIMGYMGLLKKTDLAKNQMRFVENALQAVRNSNELIRKVGNLEKLKEKSKLRTISLNPTMEKVIRDLYPQATARGIKIQYRPVKMKVKADSLFEDILSNLIHNAIVHSGCKTLSISAGQKDTFCTIAIEDDGKGIPDEDKERIFQRGIKGKESRGSGIGLYLVKMIVENYNGRVEVVDRVKGEHTKGTRLNVFIPCTH
jgi:PAS domain S-box-containing protein